MPKFIKVTFTNTSIFINVDVISSFYREISKNVTYLYTIGDSQYFQVEETPDEILALIKNS